MKNISYPLVLIIVLLIGSAHTARQGSNHEIYLRDSLIRVEWQAPFTGKDTSGEYKILGGKLIHPLRKNFRISKPSSDSVMVFQLKDAEPGVKSLKVSVRLREVHNRRTELLQSEFQVMDESGAVYVIHAGLRYKREKQ